MKEPLVLLHGFTGCAATWDRLVPLLEPRHEILAPTLVGHYGGPALPLGMTNPIATMADEIERQMDEAGWDRAHIVGNSLGGWLAFEMGARGRALSVVALSPAMGWETDEPPAHTRRMFVRMHRAAPYVPRVAEKLSRRPGFRRLVFRDVAKHAERMSPREAYDLMIGTTGCTMFEPFLEFIEAGNYRSQWPEDLGVPTRIAWSEFDRTLPEKTCTGWYRSAFPEAEWVVMQGCGHLPQHDDPELVAKTILEVTDRLPAATAAAARS